MHPALWGDFTWRITGKDANGDLTKEGGWQNNRGGGINQDIQFVENIFEELDAPGEWFLNSKTHTLYFYPPAGLDLKSAVVEATRLRTLVEFRGDEAHPVKWITLRGLTFRQAARTVMDTREPLLRSDWAIYRGGAIFFNGAEDCALEDSFIDQVGGNAVFVNNYNRRVAIRGTQIARAGASGICFVGDPQAARSPLFNYDQVQQLDEIDRTPGPKTDNYPADCLVDNCLIHLTGRVEKQTAGVEIDLAQNITVRHCSIYDMPRAGINIGDGCWGGHVIEYCDIFDTVKETGDHGSFNSWGRDRFWRPNIGEVNAWVKQVPELPLLDAVKPIVLAQQPLALRSRLGHRPRRRLVELHHHEQPLPARRHQEPRGLRARGRKQHHGGRRLPSARLVCRKRRHFPAQHRLDARIVRPTCRRRRGARRWITTWCRTTARRRTRPRRSCSSKADATNIPSWPTRNSLIRRTAIIA